MYSMYAVWGQYGSGCVCVTPTAALCFLSLYPVGECQTCTLLCLPGLKWGCLIFYIFQVPVTFETHKRGSARQYIFYLVSIQTGTPSHTRLFHQLMSIGDAREPLQTKFFFLDFVQNQSYFHRTVGSLTFSTLFTEMAGKMRRIQKKSRARHRRECNDGIF